MGLKRLACSWTDEFGLIRGAWSGEFPPTASGKGKLSPLEAIFVTLVVGIRMLSLVRIKELFSDHGTRSAVSDAYVAGWFVVLVILLWHPLPGCNAVYGVVGYRLVDSLNYRLGILFVDRYRSDWGLKSLDRSMLLLLVNYGEVVIGFAILYLTTQSIAWSSGGVVAEPLGALYFSAVTASTVGYGDITPQTTPGRWLAISELASVFILVVVVVGMFLTGVRGVQEEPRSGGA
jgi:hypothetical protein